MTPSTSSEETQRRAFQKRTSFRASQSETFLEAENTNIENLALKTNYTVLNYQYLAESRVYRITLVTYRGWLSNIQISVMLLQVR